MPVSIDIEDQYAKDFKMLDYIRDMDSKEASDLIYRLEDQSKEEDERL